MTTNYTQNTTFNRSKTNTSKTTKLLSVLSIIAVLVASGQVIASETTTISAVTESNIHQIYKALTKTRKKGKGLLVLFYSPNCGHCQAFEKMYLKAAKKLADKSDGGLNFLKADC